MSDFKFKGHISYSTKKRYKWIAEFGKNTCETCLALNGQEFDEKDVPYWPHPNCRCKVEEISIVDEIEAELNEYKEEIEQLLLQTKELLGDSNILRNKIKKSQQETKNNEIKSLETKLTKIEYDIYKLIDQIQSLTGENTSKYTIQKIENTIDKYKNLLDNIGKFLLDISINVIGTLTGLEDAKEFYNIASKPNLMNNPNEYLNKNGKIVLKISDLNNRPLEDFIKKKIKSQYNAINSKGVIYHTNSSPAKMIKNSKEFRKYINENKNNLILGNYPLNTTLTLKSTFNNFLTFHHCDLYNLKINNNGDLNAMVIDTVDYNANEPLVKIPRHYQENGKLKNYYVIVMLTIPQNEWIKY